MQLFFMASSFPIYQLAFSGKKGDIQMLNIR